MDVLLLMVTLVSWPRSCLPASSSALVPLSVLSPLEGRLWAEPTLREAGSYWEFSCLGDWSLCPSHLSSH